MDHVRSGSGRPCSLVPVVIGQDTVRLILDSINE
jgi:hypothetical protein